jgi:predicted nucleic acid-binding protein
MLIVDATCLYEVVADTEQAESVRTRLAEDQDHAAPHLVDVEVRNVIRRHEIEGRLDATAATQAVDDLYAWPGERFGHRGLLSRAWDLRHNIRGWDAFYVALAEALDGTVLTLDRRLPRANGPTCPIEVVTTER